MLSGKPKVIKENRPLANARKHSVVISLSEADYLQARIAAKNAKQTVAGWIGDMVYTEERFMARTEKAQTLRRQAITLLLIERSQISERLGAIDGKLPESDTATKAATVPSFTQFGPDIFAVTP